MRMRTLVGRYLVEAVATGYTSRRARQWRSTWFIRRSTMETESGWEVFEAGELRGPFGTEEEAKAAAYKFGVHRARGGRAAHLVVLNARLRVKKSGYDLP
jgi:hypothetical protein